MSLEIRDEKFVPRGAVAFLVGLMVLYTAIWLGLYVLLLGRA